MLELSLDEPLSPTVREYLSTACDSARTLAGNLNLMLELAQINARPSQVRETPLNFKKIVDSALDRLARATQDRVEVRIAPDVENNLHGDVSQLERLASTLVEHAARWLEHPHIVVEVGGEPLSPDKFLLKMGISEYGLGSQEKQSQLRPYDPVETSKYASPGLELAIVRRWLDRVGGMLFADSVTAGGRFLVKLPLSRTAPTLESGQTPDALQQQPQAEPDASPVDDFEGPLDVLVVDDTEANQKVVKAVLAKRGHRVELAGNGQQALDQLNRRKFDVVLMDAQMPLMNGFEATAAIRMLPETSRSHVPIIAMTAHALQEDRLRCLAAGMDDYLAKPIDVATLVAHVEYYGHSGPKPATAPESVSTHNERAVPAQDFLAGARARLAGDEALLLELIRLFRQDATSLLEKIASGLSNADSELASRAAHNLRGLAANFDDAQTISAAGAVEQLAIEGDFRKATSQLETLRAECRRLIQALSDYEQRETARNEL